MDAWFMKVSLGAMEVWLMAKAVWSIVIDVWSMGPRSIGSMLIAGEGVVGWADDIRSILGDVVVVVMTSVE
jgi:hypothetical protein